MKIRFWKQSDFGVLASILILACFNVILDYFKTSNIDFFLFWFVLALCFIYFIPNYFSYILEVADKCIFIKNSTFRKPKKIELRTIKSINLVNINNRPVYIAIKLQNENEIPWYTRNRTEEMYNILMEYINLK